jgi:predicted RNA-binding Zn ribbon-like protein
MNKKLSVKVEAQSVSLCLDFANTSEWHASREPVEQLNSYADLVAWAVDAGLVASQRGAQLNQLASQQPARAEAALAQAISIREVIYRIFSAATGIGESDPADLDILNEALSAAMGNVRLSIGDASYEWGWSENGGMDEMLWPVVRSAAGLLTAPELLMRVGRCADKHGCGYLFLDLSKNRSRRWCDIGDCGNRAKQRRHYQRVRQKQVSG